MANYDDIVRRSIRKDFMNANYKKERKTKPGRERIVSLSKESSYYSHRKLIVGRLVRVIRQGVMGGYWVEFVYSSDRDALNNACGWKDKTEFLLDGVKFKNNE